MLFDATVTGRAVRPFDHHLRRVAIVTYGGGQAVALMDRPVS